MKRYFRPLGLLHGPLAAQAVAAGLALPLVGGLAFTLVEVIKRDGADVERRIVRATDALIGGVSPLHAPSPLKAEGWGGGDAGAPFVMGVVNATPDSFSDGGAFLDADRAVAHGLVLIAAGARIVDVGGESTRPGASPVDPAEERRRVLPVIAGLRDAAGKAEAVISIDTRNAGTMQAAVAAGAGVINDVSALTHDPEAMSVAAASGLPVILMHMRGAPRTMQDAPAYDDAALDVYDYLDSRISACADAGIDRSLIMIDPGIGFGKTVAHNLALLNQLTLFHGLGAPILVGVSRKGFIARLSAGEPASDRLPGSLAAGLWAAQQGARILRVHDVAETMQALRMADALRAG
jgi:dihydropteroate synthase